MGLKTEPVTILAELTVAILLFIDASTARISDAEEGARFPGRLLFVGLRRR